MNDRLLNHPVPPRELNPAITPELQEVIYRALERDPDNRYSTANEFAWDLEHLDQVGVADRAEASTWKRKESRPHTVTSSSPPWSSSPCLSSSYSSSSPATTEFATISSFWERGMVSPA